MFFTSINLTNDDSEELSGTIIWDSGASTHVMRTEAIRYMTNVTRRNTTVFMNHVPTRATHIGDVIITVQTNFIQLKDVLIVPDSNADLISISRLQRAGYGICFPPTAVDSPLTMTLEHGGTIVVEAKFSSLPTTSFRYVNYEEINFISPNSVPSWITSLHKRLTHVKCSGIKVLEATKKLRLTKQQRAELLAISRVPCRQCDAAGMKKAPIRSVSTPPLDKDGGTVHVDLHGPLIVSIGGAVFILAARHAVSGIVVIRFAANKGEAAREALKDAVLTMKRTYNIKIKFLRSDRGGEFMSTDITLWLRSQGIQPQPTEAESSRQNGMVEAIWAILLPRAKAMLLTANMQKVFWADAVSYASKVLNMLPSRTRNNRSPIEIATGRQPDLRSIQPWGCLVMVKVLRGDMRKGNLSSLAKKCILLNFSGPGGYKCMHMATRKIVHSRDVSFYPDIFPFAGQQVPTDPDFEAETDEEANTRGAEKEACSLPPAPLRKSRRVTWDVNNYDPSAFITRETVYKESWALQPKTVRQALHPNNPNRDKWREAIRAEVKGLIDNKTFIIDDCRPGDERLPSHFVLGHKTGPTGETTSLKARLCANGKAQMDTNSFAPTPKWSTIRFFLKLIVDRQLYAQQVDVKQAYLLSLLPKGTNIVIGPPVGFPFPVPTGKILRLLRCLYGLKQSGRHWNKNVHAFITGIERLGFVRSDADPCFYVDTKNNVFILVFVDDFIIAGVKLVVQRVLALFKRKYPIKELGEPSWYLKCKIVRNQEQGWLHFSQQAYVQAILEEAGMSDCNPTCLPCDDFLYVDEKEVPVTQEKAERQRKIIGMLLYLSIATRGDISFAIGQLCKYMAKPFPKVWTYTKRVLRYLKGTLNFGILFNKSCDATLVGYTDSDWAGDKSSRKSVSGAVWEFGGAIVSWKCKQQSTVATSPMQAELIALTEGAKEGMYLRKLVQSVGAIGPTTLFVDNAAALINAKEFRVTQGNKHIETRHFYIRELVEKKLMDCKKIPSKSNKSDMMTKPQQTADFLRNRESNNFVACPELPEN